MPFFTSQRIEKITEIIKDVAKHYNLSNRQIEDHLKWLHEKTIPGLENKYFISGEKGLIQECETWIRKNEENTDDFRKMVNSNLSQEFINSKFFDFAMNIKKHEYILSEINSKQKPEQETPKTFEELFHNIENAEPCLKILSELTPPIIDGNNNYIGKGKGVFALWIKVLKNYKPKPLVKHFKDTIYKDILNEKIKGLNLTNDASEFRKQYKRLENSTIELDIKAILSQYSQNGKLGK